MDGMQPAARLAQKQGAVAGKSGEFSGDGPLSHGDAGDAAKSCGARRPVSADNGEVAAIVPRRQPRRHGRGQPFERIVRLEMTAVCGQRGGAIAGVVRRVSQVDPDADRHRRVASILGHGLDQDARKLGAIEQHVVGPLERQLPASLRAPAATSNTASAATKLVCAAMSAGTGRLTSSVA
jgi:hypothetical protein